MSLRVRITAVAVAVTAIALAAGGWVLVRSVESTQLGRIADATEQRVDAIVAQLRAGVPPEQLQLADRPEAFALGGIVQIIADGGDVLVASPAAAGERPLVTTRTAGASGTGAVRVQEPLPGSFEAAVSLDVRYEEVETPTGTVTVLAASPLSEVTRSLDAVRRSLWLALPLVVALLGVVTWLVTGRALRPVDAMRAEADSISHTTLHRRIPEPATADEVGRLARTLNAMLDRLQASAEQQRQFVADASHELRTPVATLRAELEVAERAPDEQALRAGIAGALAEEGRLEALLADLLLLASVDERTATLDPAEVVDLAALATAEAARPRARPVTVTGSGSAVGSPRQLERAVRNLLDNAARHARTTVTVGVGEGWLAVEDDGPGIADADRARAFERFGRLDEGRARDAGGTGLGLAIVQAVAEAHGGRVAVDRSPTLGGARFVLTLRAT
jgi:signal transduction histidine kinase